MTKSRYKEFLKFLLNKRSMITKESSKNGLINKNSVKSKMLPWPHFVNKSQVSESFYHIFS